jgi:hypothetical protein
LQALWRIVWRDYIEVCATSFMRRFDAAFARFLLRFTQRAPYSMPEDLQAWNC